MNIYADKQQIPAELETLSELLRNKYGACIQAILGYGSCFRDNDFSQSLIDAYVIVDNYRNVHKSLIARIGNYLIPPNVYYYEFNHNSNKLRAKYAVISSKQFTRKMIAYTPYFWARFAQPTTIIYSKDQIATSLINSALEQARNTMIRSSIPLASGEITAEKIWVKGLEATYATEFRPESKSRAKTIFTNNAQYYENITQNALRQNIKPKKRNLVLQRFAGKSLTILRIFKAAFTFNGGVEYIKWKIKRHSGVEIQLKEWHKRHPILAAIILLPQAYRKGGIK